MRLTRPALRHMSQAKRVPVFTEANIPPYLHNVHYAVRGELVLRAAQHQKQLLSNPKALPFERITYCNIGNPQQLGQPPLTFIRQVLALVECPQLLDNPDAAKIFPRDAIQRARHILAAGGPTGAYSESQGLEHVRQSVARFINRRDGFAPTADYAKASDIFLSDGASPAVQMCLRMAIRGERDGVLLPIPQYPLYSAAIPLFGGQAVPYYLDEDHAWRLDVRELRRAVTEAREKGVDVRALVVINPGNPTGATLGRQNMEEVVTFCADEGLALMADEVYQENVYIKSERPFTSFKRVLYDMGSRARNVELMSFHSISKGFLGECGKRGGYVEMVNIDPRVRQEFYKIASISLCPNVTGQIVLSLMVEPPEEGEPSHALYVHERDTIYNSLKRRAQFLVRALNELPGIDCQPAEGAMYAFPRITLPPKAVKAAEAAGRAPDTHYCIELLDATGLCVVPGSGFGQRKGEWHFRTTFLPSEEALRSVLTSFADFHKGFLSRHIE